MTEPIIITVAGSPVAKGRPRFIRSTGHAITPEKTRSYEGVLRHFATEAMGSRPPLDQAVTLDLLAVMPIPASWSRKKRADAEAGVVRPCGRPDLDNLLKAIDALNGIVWRDDSQVVSASLAKVYGVAPALRLTVRPL